MVPIQVAQPKAVAKYYEAAGTIDIHSRIHVDELRMNCNLATKDWVKRFNIGILGIVCVDTYLFFQQVVHVDTRTTSCLKFFGRLEDKIIKNQEGVCVIQAVVMNQVAPSPPPQHLRHGRHIVLSTARGDIMVRDGASVANTRSR
jgi:hypothetical protein